MHRALAALLAAALTITASAAPPSGAADAAVPPPLQIWRGWVLEDLGYRACPFLHGSQAKAPGDFICAWPGRLTVSSTPAGATFSMAWRIDAPSRVVLPGDASQWPQQVTVDGQRQPVVERDGRPEIALEIGTHLVAGRIPWREQPQALVVPAAIGLVALSVDGKPVLPVQRDGEMLTLGRAAAAAPEADNLDLRVFRKLTDGVPANLTTRIVVRVAGQAREETLGPVLPEGFVATALSAAFPARLDADGRLHLQVQPGADTVTIEARAGAPLAAVVARVADAPWPRQEVWSYESAPRLRVTAASSALQVDPRQAEVPSDWQMLPAFALADGARLAIEERSRGLAPDEANRLSLQREAWLDFDGGGWFARDLVGGRMVQGWRFDAAAPFVLEQAAARSARGSEPLLVTRGARPELSGVEWRTPAVDLSAGLRVQGRGELPVAGWQQTFDSVRTTLHLPYGYKLVGAPGADAVAGSWASAWDLLDAFVCAIGVLLAWRFGGLLAALAVIGYFALGYQESDAPRWTLIAVLGLALVARALPRGRLARVAEWLRRGALALLVLVALPFAADQVRFALYPQLESGGQPGYPVAGGMVGAVLKDDGRMQANAPQPMADAADEVVAVSESAPMPAAAPPPPPEQEATKASTASPVIRHKYHRTEKTIEAKAAPQSSRIDRYGESTVVQTGAGMPNWNLGSTAWLSWNGPVDARQQVRLLIAPPWLVRPLRIALVALLAFVIVRLLRNAAAGPIRGAGVAARAAIVLAAGLALTTAARAQEFPGDDLLSQLRERLTRAPECTPACAAFAEARIGASGDGVSVAIEAHAAGRLAVPLPSDPGLSLRSLRVDGVAGDSLRRDASGALWLALDRGVHRIELDFAVATDRVALAFALKPARVLFDGRGWQASGLAEDRLLGETVNLARERSGEGGDATGDRGQQFPPYVRVVRSLTLGLDWSATTLVERLSPAQGGFTVDVPLLASEHVTSTGTKVQNGRIPVAIGEGEWTDGWSSTLDKGEELKLTAPALSDRAEVWHVLVSPTWHVEFGGVPGVGLEPGADASDYRDFEFHPLPGETLTLKVTRPTPAQGGARAIDAVSLQSEVGAHASTHALEFTVRASQGGDQVITLPKDADILGVTRDGAALNVRLLEGRLSLPLLPGAHRYAVSFRDRTSAGAIVSTPTVDLGLAAANVTVSQRVPADRWLLAATGPAVGPAVLYWGELVVMVVLAAALARTRRTPLRFRDWLLLGLGFSTFSWIALLVVVAWLFAFDWRARAALPAPRWQFNLLQVALAGLTAVALVALVSAIPQGLAGNPDMHVTGNASNAWWLRWFADRSAGVLPVGSAISVPLWVYKVLMLAWAIWLANALIGWLRSSFAAWTRDGYWRQRMPPPAPLAEGAAPVQ